MLSYFVHDPVSNSIRTRRVLAAYSSSGRGGRISCSQGLTISLVSSGQGHFSYLYDTTKVYSGVLFAFFSWPVTCFSVSTLCGLVVSHFALSISSGLPISVGLTATYNVPPAVECYQGGSVTLQYVKPDNFFYSGQIFVGNVDVSFPVTRECSSGSVKGVLVQHSSRNVAVSFAFLLVSAGRPISVWSCQPSTAECLVTTQTQKRRYPSSGAVDSSYSCGFAPIVFYGEEGGISGSSG